MDYVFSLFLRQLRLEWKMAKLLGIDTVHEYINIVTKGFSANMAYNTALY